MLIILVDWLLSLFGIFCLIILDHSSLCSSDAKTKPAQK